MNNDRGFTLIEVIIITLLIAVMFIPLYSLIRRGNTIIYQSENNIKASNLCAEGLEWLASYSFSELYAMTSGQQLNGMYVVEEGTPPEDAWWTLKNYSAVIPSTGTEQEFKYSAEFGGEGTGSDKGGYRDFQRIAFIKKHNDNTLQVRVVVRWAEMGKKDSFRSRELSRILCRQSLKF